MPEKKTIQRARQAEEEGKAPSTQAGEFVHEEIEHVRKGKHGVRNTKQAIAIGLSKARRAGVDLPPPEEGRTSESTRRKSEKDYDEGQGRRRTQRRPRVSRAIKAVMEREGRSAVSRKALSKQARSSARRRSPAQRSASARKAARTRTRTGH